MLRRFNATAWVAIVTTAAVVLLHLLTGSDAAPTAAAPVFGYTTSASRFVIHSGSGLTISMQRSTCDIVSLLYKDQELQYKGKYTHVNSGLGAVSSATIATLADAKKTIQVTCVASNGITQYYFFRPHENAIYMGTHHNTDAVLPELRFLARLDRATVATGIAEATLDDTVGAIEAHDVFATRANVTRSKFYSGVPFKDDRVHGVRGAAAGIYFVLSDAAYETSSSGPFFRDINNQCTTANELTFYMKSDHTRTEDYRYGFHGPYALVFTDGPAPASAAAAADFAFFQTVSGLKGFVNDADRGTITGTIHDPHSLLTSSGASDTVVVGFANSVAQYWTQLRVASASASTSTTFMFTSPRMKPGSYKLTVYKKQLAVATASVTVRAGETLTAADVTVSSVYATRPIWRIGEWDGTPDGFLNADKIHRMHPSDARMTKWTPVTFRIGTDTAAAFPMALFRGVNDPVSITFALSAAQVAATTTRTLRIGVSLAQSSARPSVRVNDKWSAPVPASAAVKTRGITRGVTTGNYQLYEYAIPVSALHADANTVAISIASGASDPPEPFLAASVVFDALELV